MFSIDLCPCIHTLFVTKHVCRCCTACPVYTADKQYTCSCGNLMCHKDFGANPARALVPAPWQYTGLADNNVRFKFVSPLHEGEEGGRRLCFPAPANLSTIPSSAQHGCELPGLTTVSLLNQALPVRKFTSMYQAYQGLPGTHQPAACIGNGWFSFDLKM